MTGSELLLETAKCNRTAPLTPGQSHTRSVSVEHNVINPTSQEVVFIEIEMRSSAMI
jgi:mannose-6-phosphate isomerase-like protein (cupin superfamily)